MRYYQVFTELNGHHVFICMHSHELLIADNSMRRWGDPLSTDDGKLVLDRKRPIKRRDGEYPLVPVLQGLRTYWTFGSRQLVQFLHDRGWEITQE